MLFILKTIIHSRKFILASGVITAVLAIAVSFFLPSWYTATTSIFPPDAGGGMMSGYAQLLQQSLQIPLPTPSAVGARPNTIYIDILLSEQVSNKIIEEFDLKRLYDTELNVDAIGALQSHTFFSLLENGLLKLGVEDRDPERAAAMANRYVELLEDFTRDINVTRAASTKEFVGRQLEIHAVELAAAEEELKQFQQENQALKLDEQVTAAIDIVASLTAEAVAAEMELEILSQYTSTSSQEYVRKKKEYDEVLRQLKMFKADSSRAETDFVRSYFPTFDSIPELGLEMARLMRRVKTEEFVYRLLVEEYEKARIEEARDTRVVQVLDHAAVPELRSRPKRKILVIFGGIVGLGWSTLLVVFLALWREDRTRSSKIAELLGPIASDFKKVFPFGKKS